MKPIIIAIIALFLITLLYIINVIHNKVLIDKPTITLTTLSENDTNVADTIKNIISREGKVNKSTADNYTRWIIDSATKYNLNPFLILSMIFVESRFDSKAIGSSNATGLMQIIPSVHKTTSAALLNPQKNIQIGTKIISEYLQMSKNTAEGLLRYNGSFSRAPVYAIKVLKHKIIFESEAFKQSTHML